MRVEPHIAMQNASNRRRKDAMISQDCVPLEKAKLKVHYQLWNLMANAAEANLGEWGVDPDLRAPPFSLQELRPTSGGRYRVRISTVKGEFTFEMHGSLPLRRVM